MSGQFREIITKAVVAKGRKFTKAAHRVKPDHCPSSILGCWIINHRYEAKKHGKKVEIEGSYDINIWYSYDDNTKTEVVTERVNYVEEIRLKYRNDEYYDDNEVIVKVVQQPNCVDCFISPCERHINVKVEREFLTEVIGETKLCVAIAHSHECKEDHSWENEVDDEELAEIDTEFLTEQTQE